MPDLGTEFEYMPEQIAGPKVERLLERFEDRITLELRNIRSEMTNYASKEDVRQLKAEIDKIQTVSTNRMLSDLAQRFWWVPVVLWVLSNWKQIINP